MNICTLDRNYIIKEGYLEKQSLYIKQFRKRWIKLTKTHLYSFKNKYNTKATETIPLALFIDIKISQNVKHAQFQLISPKQTRTFIASSLNQMHNWIESIRSVNVVGQVIVTEKAAKCLSKKKIIAVEITEGNNTNFNSKYNIWSAVQKIHKTGSEEANGSVTFKTHSAIEFLVTEKIQILTNATMERFHILHHPLKVKVIDIKWSVNPNSNDNNHKKSYSTPTHSDEHLYENGMYVDSNQPIPFYNEGDIIELQIQVEAYHEHNILDTKITCKHMKAKESINPMDCPVYYAMKRNYQWSQENLNHLNQELHFKQEYMEKPECKYQDECKHYKRLEQGGNKLNDLCHVKLYRHPPRNRNVQLPQNVNPLIINKTHEQNNKFCVQPIFNEHALLSELIDEVTCNGFKYDLCLECKQNDQCKHNQCSILEIVDNKMGSFRHKSMGMPLNRGEMLSLILYTGGYCNYDLCSSQRKGDYVKWKYFDYCLYRAINKLSDVESGAFSVFTGLNNVKLDVKSIKCGYFVTYVSTSWNKRIAESFMNNDGMIIEIDKSFKNNEYLLCCDVSWISKFPDECEVLFARSTAIDTQ
eukprot:173987_1